MNEARVIQDAIRKLAGVGDSLIFFGDVVSVDEDNRECSVTSTLNGESITYEEVGLSAERNDGFIQIPAVGSTVAGIRMDNGEKYVFYFSDITKILCQIDASNKFVFDSNGFVWNNGTNGGLLKLAESVAKLNALENKVNAILTAINTTWIPVPNDGGAALKALFASLVGSTLAPLTLTINSDLENTSVKQ